VHFLARVCVYVLFVCAQNVFGFAHIDADPDQELQDMTLHVGDDLSTFARKFVLGAQCL